MTEEVRISAGIFMGIIDEDGEGPYQLILKEAAMRSGITISEQIYPLRRAINEFTKMKTLAIYGMTKSIIDEIGDDRIITTFPLGVFKLFLFTRNDEAPISSYDQLKDRKVGGVIGYEAYYQPLIDHDVPIDYMVKEENQFKKLEMGRIDVIIGFLPDWIPFLNNLSYDPDFPIHIDYDYMTVWKTPEGIDFVDRISHALQDMKQDGTIEKLLDDRYMDFEYKAKEKYEWISDQ